MVLTKQEIDSFESMLSSAIEDGNSDATEVVSTAVRTLWNKRGESYIHYLSLLEWGENGTEDTWLLNIVTVGRSTEEQHSICTQYKPSSEKPESNHNATYNTVYTSMTDVGWTNNLETIVEAIAPIVLLTYGFEVIESAVSRVKR